MCKFPPLHWVYWTNPQLLHSSLQLPTNVASFFTLSPGQLATPTILCPLRLTGSINVQLLSNISDGLAHMRKSSSPPCVWSCLEWTCALPATAPCTRLRGGRRVRQDWTVKLALIFIQCSQRQQGLLNTLWEDESLHANFEEYIYICLCHHFEIITHVPKLGQRLNMVRL